ncbi:SulP family inorganic anion transporter [Leifsonia sp. AG29]|uniref:SulP family inorganic anion transporter n=1 Tax=Leifsonia sp. AG29 TaxID=2598860 RepID=UPI001E4E5FFE|nr:SulP family inorganic anion transporter [Leifsonia sp. AG29]
MVGDLRRLPRVLPGLTLRTLPGEALAGVTLLAISVPVNIGYAQIAGLPPTAGLYALIVPAVVYALVASSRQLVASPDAAAAALVAASLGGLAIAGTAHYLVLAMVQAIIGGVIFILFAVLNLGFLADFLSKPILVGFVGGLALDILLSEIATMLGVPITSSADFLTRGAELFRGIVRPNIWSVVIAAGCLLVLLLGRRFAPRLPWALIVLVIATAVGFLAGIEQHGVSTLGPVKQGAPTFAWPAVGLSEWIGLVPSALSLTMVAMGEALLVARAFGERRGYRVNPNRDLLAFGAANIASGLTGGFTIGSSTSRTAAMDHAGSRTQLPALVTAAGTLLLIVFGTTLLEHIPSPAIGAIVAVAVLPLLDVREFVELWRLSRFELGIAVACFLSALLIGPVAGILIAVVLALINLARRAANPAVDVLSTTASPDHSLLPVEGPVTQTAPGLIVLRFAAPLFFANADVFENAVKRAVTEAGPDRLHDLVLDLEAVTDIDITAAERFHSVQGWLADQGVTLHYSRVRPDLERRLEHFDLVGGRTLYGTNQAAIDALER